MISLVGLPGSGKTTVGRQLARRLQLPFVDADHAIEEYLGCSIRTFFEEKGESKFRDIEALVIDKLLQTHQGVLSTGGGAILREDNRKRLHASGFVIYLSSSPQVLFRRLRHDVNRPLLQVADPMDKLFELYKIRDPLYRQTAHFSVETGAPSVSKLVNMIIMQIELREFESKDLE